MTRRAAGLERVYYFGAGKVGTALGRATRRAGIAVTLRPRRRGWPRSLRADLVVLAVRDAQIDEAAAALVGVVGPEVPVVHCAGAVGSEALSPLRAAGHPVGAMHPLLSFASLRHPPPLAGAFARVSGDPEARRRAFQLARELGMRPGELGIDDQSYHAAASLCANGAAALMGAAQQVLTGAGLSEQQAMQLLAPLLSSVAHNAGVLGMPAALTGPVRRGDARAVAGHLERLPEETLPLYRALVTAQLPLARELAEATAESFDAIERLLNRDFGASKM